MQLSGGFRKLTVVISGSPFNPVFMFLPLYILFTPSHFIVICSSVCNSCLCPIIFVPKFGGSFLECKLDRVLIHVMANVLVIQMAIIIHMHVLY